MLAANIGAGSTVGAAGLAYRDGTQRVVVGAARRGSARSCSPSVVGAATVALAKEHDFYTTGDYLEFRYGAAVRG